MTAGYGFWQGQRFLSSDLSPSSAVFFKFIMPMELETQTTCIPTSKGLCQPSLQGLTQCITCTRASKEFLKQNRVQYRQCEHNSYKLETGLHFQYLLTRQLTC
jgi:hypothetical protein